MSKRKMFENLDDIRSVLALTFRNNLTQFSFEDIHLRIYIPFKDIEVQNKLLTKKKTRKKGKKNFEKIKRQKSESHLNNTSA